MKDKPNRYALTEQQNSVLESSTMKVVCCPHSTDSSSVTRDLQDPNRRFWLKHIAASLNGGFVEATTGGVTKALTFATRAAFGTSEEQIPASQECREMIGELVPALRYSTKTSGVNWVPADNNTKIVKEGLIIGPEAAARALAQRPQRGEIFTPFIVGDPYEIPAPRLSNVFTFKTLEAVRSLRCAIVGKSDKHETTFPGRHFTSSGQIFDTRVRGAHICAGHPGSNRLSGLVTGYALVRDDPNRKTERQFVGTPGLELPIRFLLDSARTPEICRTVIENGIEKVIRTWHVQVDGRACAPRRDAQGELPEDYLVLSYLPNFLTSESLEHDSIFLIEGLHGVGTEASRILWKNARLLEELLSALKKRGMPQYWQAIFFARDLIWKENDNGVLEQEAQSLMFGEVYEVRPDFRKLETHSKNIKDTFNERWGATG